MQSLTLSLTAKQLAIVDEHAFKTGKNREAVVCRAIEHMAILDAVKPDEYAGIVAGLKALDDGRIATPHEVDAVFRKHGVL